MDSETDRLVADYFINLEKRKPILNEYYKEYHKKNKIRPKIDKKKDTCRYLDRKHLRQKLLEERKVCEFCKSKENLQMHHIDYDSPLDPSKIQFLCRTCHGKQHRKPLYSDILIFLNGRKTFATTRQVASYLGVGEGTAENRLMKLIRNKQIKGKMTVFNTGGKKAWIWWSLKLNEDSFDTVDELLARNDIDYKFLIPSIRREMVKIMFRQGMKQTDIARTLHISDASVSMYLAKQRAKAIQFSDEFKSQIELSVEKIQKGKGDFDELFELSRIYGDSW